MDGVSIAKSHPCGAPPPHLLFKSKLLTRLRSIKNYGDPLIPTIPHHCYAGNWTDLLMEVLVKEQLTLTSSAVHTWAGKHWDSLRFSGDVTMYQVDHVLLASIGGVDHPYNLRSCARR